MIALNLFDMLADFADANPSDEQATRVHHAAIRLLASLLLEWNQLRELEAETGPTPWDDRAKALQLSRELHSLHARWAETAEQVLRRVRLLPLTTDFSAKIEEVADALGRTRARLLHTPEKQDHAFEQARLGQTIPAKELRDDLNTRLRARRQVPMART